MFANSAASASSCWRTAPSINASFMAVTLRWPLDKSDSWLPVIDVGFVPINLLRRLRFRRGLFPLADALRDSRGQRGIIGLAREDNHHTLVRDDIFADVLAVVAAAHFDHDHHL